METSIEANTEEKHFVASTKHVEASVEANIEEETGVKDKSLKIPKNLIKHDSKWEEKVSDIEKSKKKNVPKKSENNGKEQQFQRRRLRVAGTS